MAEKQIAEPAEKEIGTNLPKPAKFVKKAEIYLTPNRERVVSEDEESDDDLEIENWPEDGKENIIPVGKAVVVSIHLAQRLVAAGRIKNFRVVSLQIN